MTALATKVILTDCDGVLLDWEYSFHNWIQSHGYVLDPGVTEYGMHNKYNTQREEMKRMVRMFNESAQIGWLSPMRDAIKYVRKLHEEHGYVFHVITSLTKDPFACELRTQNLQRVFGPTVFERFIYLDTGEDKDEALLPYEGSDCFWIEDKRENAEVGMQLGLNSILMAHEHNTGSYIPRMSDWKSIYSHITSYRF